MPSDIELSPVSLMFCCPATLTETESGVRMNAQTFRDIATLMIRVHCHACGNVHWFKAGDGHLVGLPVTANRAA